MNIKNVRLLNNLIFVFSILYVMIFLIVFNFSAIEGIHYADNLISVQTGVQSSFLSHLFLISFIIAAGIIANELWQLSENINYHKTIIGTLTFFLILIPYCFCFIVPHYENINIDTYNKKISLEQGFLVRGVSRKIISFDDIKYIKYTMTFYNSRGTRNANYINSVNLVLANGEDLLLSISTQDINGIELRNKLARELARVTKKELKVLRQ